MRIKRVSIWNVPGTAGGQMTRCWTSTFRPDLGAAPLVMEFWPMKNSEPRLKPEENVYLESHRGRKSEWAGMGSGSKVAEAEGGHRARRGEKCGGRGRFRCPPRGPGR